MRSPFPEELAKETIPHPPKKRFQSLKTWQLFAVFGVFALVMLVGFGVIFFYVYQLSQTTPITVMIGGESRIIQTRAETVQDVLNRLDVDLNAGDQISLDVNAPITDGMLLRIDRARPVAITIDGETRVHYTIQSNPSDILSALNITLTPDDRILLDGTQADPLALAQWPVPVNQILIRRTQTVRLIDDNNERIIQTAAETVGEALHDAGLVLYAADRVTPDINTPLEADMTITLTRSQPVTIVADGETVETRTQAETVGALLADAGVVLMGLDYSIPGEQVQVQPGMSVRVIRVVEEIISETEVIPFESVADFDPALELDQVRLVQAGESGLRRTDTRVRYENGAEVSRDLQGTYVVREPKNRVVAYGTGVVLRTIETEAGARQYWRKLRLLTTSYHPAALGGSNITATGRILTKGIVGIDPTVIPYGTELYIPGYGIGIAADTGGPRSTRLWIDLGYDDDNWIPWSQYTDVYILAPVPDNIQYILPD